MSLNLGKYSKFITAAVGEAVLFAQVEWGGSNKWVQLAIAAAAALGVFAVPNTAAKGEVEVTVPPVQVPGGPPVAPPAPGPLAR